MCSVFSNVSVYLTYLTLSPIFIGQIQCKERQTIEEFDEFWQWIIYLPLYYFSHLEFTQTVYEKALLVTED